MRTPEGIEKQRVKHFLDERGIWHVSPFMRGYGRTGIPDILACWNGRLVAIEVKRESARLTKLQAFRLNELKNHGAITAWGTAEQVVLRLRAMGIE